STKRRQPKMAKETPSNKLSVRLKPKTIHTYSYFKPWEILFAFGNIFIWGITTIYQALFTHRHDKVLVSVRNDKESDPEYVAAIKYVTKMSDSFQWLAIFRVILSRNVAEFAMLLHVILRALDTIDGMNAKERDLMSNLPKLVKVFSTLEPATREIITTVATEMATGMIKYLRKLEIYDYQDYEEYCYYVCAVIQMGFWKYGISQGMENTTVPPINPRGPFTNNPMAASMMFQGVHMLTSFFEDSVTQATPPRLYWPKCLVQKYAPDQRDFLNPANITKGVACLNEFVAHHLTYMWPSVARLDEMETEMIQGAYRFIMLLQFGNLAMFYGNHDSFRRRLTPSWLEVVLMFEGGTSKARFCKRLKYYGEILVNKVQAGDGETGKLVIERVHEIMAKCDIELSKLRV
ncbi:Squalene synthase, partial [Folsomia candida]